MRIPIIAGNWKMNTTVGEAVQLVKEMLPKVEKVQGVEKVLCPPFVSLSPLHEILRNSSVKLGAQNLYYLEKGAFTGEISPLMLSELCQYVIVGHSERRTHFFETDDLVNRKVLSCLKANLKPILCVGETLEQREKGKTEEVISTQVNKGLASASGGAARSLVIAYEPLWAIGTGKAATGEEANRIIGLIRRILTALFGSEIASAVRIQYGGSVTSSNIAEFIKQKEIDGALVGGASLKAEEFLSILEQTALIKSN
jgi:triosephosphate isomerase